jgi:ribosomal protein S18 acetylase RimI-like enzyme
MSLTKIVEINTKNYHLYCDMLYRRMKGRDRNLEEMLETKKNHSSRIEDELKNKNFYVFAAEYNSKFIGYIHIVYIPKIGKWKKGLLQIDELYVDKDFRNLGVGSKLVEKAFEIKDKLGLEKVRLYTENPIAQHVYEKFGFKIINNCVFMES